MQRVEIQWIQVCINKGVNTEITERRQHKENCFITTISEIVKGWNKWADESVLLPADVYVRENELNPQGERFEKKKNFSTNFWREPIRSLSLEKE